jgi:uncharacterized membrane protein YhaH (DUF805 family)
MFFLFSSLPASSSKQPVYTPIGGLIMRMYWLILGHIAVVVLGVAIFMHRIHDQLLYNLLYLVAVVLCSAARFIDIKYYKGLTSDGDPSTMAHWRRYSLFVAAYAVPLWIVVQLILRLGNP